MATDPASPEAPMHAATQPGGDCLPAAGRLFYVVGASGVGKDTLLHWLREQFARRTAGSVPAPVFARRSITRAPHPSEAHESIDVTQFWQRVEAGQYALHWQANGLCYGIGRDMEDDLAAGRDVIVNGSREHVPTVLESHPRSMVVWISADAGTIGARLASRQRESGAALALRLARGDQFTPLPDRRIVHIDNSGALDTAGAQLLALLERGRT